MNRRNWLTAIVGSVAWLLFGRKAQAEPLKELGECTFTQHWEPSQTVSFEWRRKDTNETGMATFDIPFGCSIVPGLELAVTLGNETWYVIVERLLQTIEPTKIPADTARFTRGNHA
jgi:hypothetical protein